MSRSYKDGVGGAGHRETRCTGKEYWKSRLHTHGEEPGRVTKRLTHRKERRDEKAELVAALEVSMSRKELFWVGVFGLMAVLLLTALTEPAQAEEPYFEAWAVRGQSYTRNFPDVTERLFEQRGYWGAEFVGRVPIHGVFGHMALFGRLSSEGAAGSHSYRDPGTWTRAVGEIGASYRVLTFADGLKTAMTAEEMRPTRYTCAVFGGYGLSHQLERGRNLQHVSDEQNELAGPPPRYGGGLHCRDDTLRMWANVRAEWDEAVGPGVHPAVTIHFPLFGEKGALGLDAVFGDYMKIQLQVKARLFAWGGK